MRDKTLLGKIGEVELKTENTIRLDMENILLTAGGIAAIILLVFVIKKLFL